MIGNKVGPVIIHRKMCLWIKRVKRAFLFFFFFGVEACLEALRGYKCFFHHVLSMITIDGRACDSYQVAVIILMVVVV